MDIQPEEIVESPLTISASHLPTAIIGLMRADTSPDDPKDALFSAMDDPSDVGPDALNFAEYLAFSEIVPIEQSPLSLASLAGLSSKLAKAGAITTGIFVGISADRTPLLLLTVPAGIVICGIGFTFTKWFEKNGAKLFDRLLGIDKHPVGLNASEIAVLSKTNSETPLKDVLETNDMQPRRRSQRRTQPPAGNQEM